MTLFKYYHNRVFIAFSIFSIVLSSLSGYAFFIAIHKIDDQFRQEFLTQFQDKLTQRYQIDGSILISDSIFSIQTLRSDKDTIPAQLGAMNIGYAEITEGKLHVIKGSLFDRVKQQDFDYYLVHESQDSHAINKNIDKIFLAIGLVALSVSLIGITIGRILSRQITSPVRALQQQIRSTDPRKITQTPLKLNDEFGEISEAYSETLARIHQAFEREKRFSAYASHELRTPVTIIKSSLNLWQTCDSLSNKTHAEHIKHKAIRRVEVATTMMTEVIQTFLMLSSRVDKPQEFEEIDFKAVLMQVLLKYQNSENYSQIKVKKNLKHSPFLHAHRHIVTVILSTLLRNSFEYCAGEIALNLQAEHLEISNDIDELRVTQAEHFGFGLEIVHQLCEQLGWTASTEHKQPSSFVVRINFWNINEGNNKMNTNIKSTYL